MATKTPNVKHVKDVRKAPSTSVHKSMGSEKKEWYKSEWMPVFAVTIAAFIIRVFNIGIHTFWVDEYLHIIPAWEFVEGKGLNHIDGFNGIFTTWVEIFFMFFFGSSELATRLPMTLFSSLTIPILYLLTKKVTNRDIAIITIVLYALSLYSVFWGRVVRNYATFLPFFLLIHLFFIHLFEPQNGWTNRQTSLSLKKILLFFVLIIVSVLNHPLTIFFFFGLFCFGTILWVINLVKREGKHYLLNKYSLFPILLLAFTMLWNPSFGGFVQKALSVLLPQNIVDFQTPNLDRLLMLFNTKRYEAFDIYWGVMTSDMLFLPILGALGFIVCVMKFSKYGLYIAAHFVFILFLMSFVFRDAALARYLYFIYPFLLIAVATAIWFISNLIFRKIVKTNADKFRTYIMLLAIVVVIVICKPSNLKAFLTRTEHGQLVDKNISEWYYTNWKDPIDYVRQNMTEGDVILSTVPNAPRLYLGVDSAKLGWFRQMHYDGTEKKYVQNTPDGKKVSGYTTEEFMSTVKNNPRGWLLADYYFYNVMTDPQARQFAIEHLDYHFGASRDGSVQVFSWDNSKPKTEETPILIELGKPLGRSQSDEMSFNLNLTGQDKVLFIFDEEGIDVSGEAVIQINGGQMFPIPKPENSRGWGKEYATMEIPAQYLNNGSNKAQFYYNPQVVTDDIRPGFVIYNVRMR